MIEKKNYFYGIDFLRWIAALGVVLYHYTLHFQIEEIKYNSFLNYLVINKPKQIIKEEIRNPAEPLNVFVCPNVVYFPLDHDLPISAAIGSLIAKINIGV